MSGIRQPQELACDGTQMLQVTSKSWMGKARLREFLAEISEDPGEFRSDYLPRSNVMKVRATPQESHDIPLSEIVDAAGRSSTGLAVFRSAERAVAVSPPFPLRSEVRSDGVEAGPLLGMLDTEYCVGIVLLRLGRYAVGVVRGDKLIASKTGSRYVKNRHRKGGSSAGRFARSRERLVRELYDKCCEVTKSVFASHESSIDYVLLGGERHTLNGFQKRCGYVRDFGDALLERVLEVDRPGQRALEGIGRQMWRSSVVTLELQATPANQT